MKTLLRKFLMFLYRPIRFYACIILLILLFFMYLPLCESCTKISISNLIYEETDLGLGFVEKLGCSQKEAMIEDDLSPTSMCLISEVNNAEEITVRDLLGTCSIDKFSKDELSQEEFLKSYAFQKPVVIVNATDNDEFKRLTTLESLLLNLGKTNIKLSSANSYSYENRILTFEQYCQDHLKPQSLSALGNETFYFFGDNDNEDWFSLLMKYNFPPYYLPAHVPQSSFGIAGPGSGVPFHFHGPGFAETLWGRKRWFMYPPKASPSFHPNRTTLQWLHEEYPRAKLQHGFLECTLNPGELIYFPDHWWHATLNVDVTVFMSTFLSPFGP